MERRKRLQNLGLSPVLLQLSFGTYPHSVLRSCCEHRPEFFGGHDEKQALGPYGTEVLWWSDSYTLVCCGQNGAVGPDELPDKQDRVLFWEWDYDDPNTDPWLIATSETGLFFWLFGKLVQYGDGTQFDCGDLNTLRQAARAVGFEQLDEVLRFRHGHNNDTSYQEALQRRAVGIEA